MNHEDGKERKGGDERLQAFLDKKTPNFLNVLVVCVLCVVRRVLFTAFVFMRLGILLLLKVLFLLVLGWYPCSCYVRLLVLIQFVSYLCMYDIRNCKRVFKDFVNEFSKSVFLTFLFDKGFCCRSLLLLLLLRVIYVVMLEFLDNLT